MNGNSFSIVCRWRERVDSIEVLGEYSLSSFDKLSKFIPFCQRWKVADRSREAMVPLDVYRHRMIDLVKDGVSRDDGEPDPDFGYHVAAVNDASHRSELVSIDVWGGVTLKLLERAGAVGLKTSTQGYPDPSIVAYPVMRQALLTLIDIWRPDYGLAGSTEISRLMPNNVSIFGLSWMTYLSPPLARRITPPTTIPVERFDDGGLLLIAAEATFDVGNPVHLAGAEAIRDATAILNPPPPPPWRPGAA